ncbi:MAG: hypothetical protein ABIJ08_04685, partial [Nanoarchaeota archaeon]
MELNPIETHSHKLHHQFSNTRWNKSLEEEVRDLYFGNFKEARHYEEANGRSLKGILEMAKWGAHVREVYHSGQKRISGEGYSVHPKRTKTLLNGFHVGYTAFIGADNHDIIEEREANEIGDFREPEYLNKMGAFFFSYAIDYYIMIRSNDKIPEKEKPLFYRDLKMVLEIVA